MTIKCFLGFHNWNTWWYKVGGQEDKYVRELRTCKHCNTTDMFIGFKFVRTKCLIKFIRSKPYTPKYIGKITLDSWYLEYKERKEVEKGIRGR